MKKEIIAPIIVVCICAVLCIVSRKIIYAIFKNFVKKNAGKQKTILNLIDNIVKFIIVSFGVLIILEVYGIDTKSLVASLGIVGLVTGLALQDILKDFIVGISIIFEGQFSIGDWVKINDFSGEVMPSSLRITKLKAYTGEVKIIYNRNITEVINYSKENSNLILDIGVSYDSDIKLVKNILDNLCIKFKEKYCLSEMTCLGIQELADNSIKFRLVALTKYLDQFSINRELKKEIVLSFKKNNITIPYNQVVVHNGKRI